MSPPFASSAADPTQRLPLQTMPTIGDELSDKGVSWAWYSGGWNDANAGKPDPLFQFHHQAFNFFAKYAPGTQARTDHLKDTDDFFAALKNNSLPAVSFVKPLGPDNEHPGYADLQRGQEYVGRLVKAVQESSAWKDTAIIITYDEHGGRWDHVAPPKVDRWGPGSRVPAIIISPYAKKGFVDHTQYDTMSIIKFIETRWDVKPLGTRDATVNNLLNAFDFTAPPSTPPFPVVLPQAPTPTPTSAPATPTAVAPTAAPPAATAVLPPAPTPTAVRPATVPNPTSTGVSSSSDSSSGTAPVLVGAMIALGAVAAGGVASRRRRTRN